MPCFISSVIPAKTSSVSIFSSRVISFSATILTLFLCAKGSNYVQSFLCNRYHASGICTFASFVICI